MQPRPYSCGLDAAVDVIDGKWKVLIIWALAMQKRRFGELKRRLPGISEKVLAQHLREMESDEIVHREVYNETPARVEYSLTLHGISLKEALEPLCDWGNKHLERVDVAEACALVA